MKRLQQVGWGLRSHPGAPCAWYLAPRIDASNKPNTGRNDPPHPPWVPVYIEADESDDD